jgi:transposase
MLTQSTPASNAQFVVTRASRRKRFNCCECEHQDHADRDAGVSVVQKWLRKQENRDVSALNTLPQVQKRELRRQASGSVDGPIVIQQTSG